MEPIAPDLRIGDPQVVAKNQPQYIALKAELVQLKKDGAIALITRWTFTPEERKAIAKGEDLYLAILTFGNPLQPLLPAVGPEVIREYVKQ